MIEIDQPESVYEAMKWLVKRLGGAKVVGKQIRPERGKAAEGWLLDCLNPDRDIELHPEQFLLLLSLGSAAGIDFAKHYVDDATGYQPSVRKPPVTVLDEATREANEAREQLAEAQRRAERADVKLRLTMEHANVNTEGMS